MKERSKESKERKVVVVVVEEKKEKEKATTTSRAGRAHEECPLNVVTEEDIDRFVDIFNEAMIRTNAVIPTVDILTAVAERQLRYLMQRYPMAKLEKMVENAAASDFLTGSGQRGFKADFEWLTREVNFIKVVNNKYANIPHERRWQDPAERIEERKQQEHERHLRNMEIEEEEREKRRQQREYDAAHAATPEEIERIMAGFELPRLTPEQEEYLRRKKESLWKISRYVR